MSTYLHLFYSINHLTGNPGRYLNLLSKFEDKNFVSIHYQTSQSRREKSSCKFFIDLGVRYDKLPNEQMRSKNLHQNFTTLRLSKVQGAPQKCTPV